MPESSSASFDRSGSISFKDGPRSPTATVFDKPHCLNKWVQADASSAVLIAGPGSDPSPASGKLWITGLNDARLQSYGSVGAKLLFMFCTVKARTYMLGTCVQLYKTPELVPTAMSCTRFLVKEIFTTHLRSSESTNKRVERSSSQPSSASFGRSGWISSKDGLRSPNANVLEESSHCWKK